jgi:uncharacterized protein YbbK (DUF523 family)
MKILVSSCLLGCPVRYDGRDKYSPEVAALGEKHELIPVCPETECGMSAPREPMSLTDGRLITNIHGEDLTGMLAAWIEVKLDELEKAGPGLAILKSKSPSCGRTGMFRQAFEKRFPRCRILDENEVGDLSLE